MQESESIIPPSHELQYSPPIPHIKSRAFQRKLIVALIVVVGLVVAYVWLPGAIWQFKIRFWERQCILKPIPPGQTVFLSGSPGMARNSPAADGLFKTAQLIYPGTAATVYLGQRRASDGVSRLIVVQAMATVTSKPGPNVVVNFFCAMPPVGMDHRDFPKDKWIAGGIFGNSARVPSSYDLQIDSATEDPADPSHFSFSYSVFYKHYTVNCWLKPEGSIKWSETDQHGNTHWGWDNRVLGISEP